MIPSKLAPKTILNLTAIALTLPGIMACSNQAWYQGTRASQERECINEQYDAKEECRRSTSQPFEEYDQERVRF